MEITKWEKLGSRYLVNEKWATLRVDTCKLQDGVVKDDYFVLEYPNWVNAVAVTEEGLILLVRQYRHAADIISLEIPGGVIDEGETPEEAIKRELLEETGFIFDSCEPLVSLYANPATANNQTFTFLMQGGKKVAEQKLDAHELLDVETYSPAAVTELLRNNQIDQALHAAALFYGLLKLQ